MDLEIHYNQLYQEATKKISSSNYTIDEKIDSSADKRFGITLLLRPDETIKHKIQRFLSKLKEIEPQQYYYQNSDIHVTVMSVISCYEGFELSKISVPDYSAVIKRSLQNIDNITIDFKGITSSGSAIMVQGFPTDESLNKLRNNLRENFRKSGLEESIDKRYSIFTAHSTVVRFRKQLRDTEKLLSVLQDYRQYNFGTQNVKEIELVYNDWYQRERFVKKLETFNLF